MRHDKSKEKWYIDISKYSMIGRQFGELVVIKQTNKRTKRGVAIWKCRCCCFDKLRYIEVSTVELRGRCDIERCEVVKNVWVAKNQTPSIKHTKAVLKKQFRINDTDNISPVLVDLKKSELTMRRTLSTLKGWRMANEHANNSDV